MVGLYVSGAVDSIVDLVILLLGFDVFVVKVEAGIGLVELCIGSGLG